MFPRLGWLVGGRAKGFESFSEVTIFSGAAGEFPEVARARTGL